MNDQFYHRDTYDDQVIEKRSKMTKYDAFTTKTSRITFQKNYLESEERYLGTGIYPREEEFYKIIEKEEDIENHDISIVAKSIVIDMSLESKRHYR